MKFLKKLTQKIHAMDTLTKVVVVIFGILAITTSIVAYGFIKNFTAGMTILNLPGIPVFNAATGEDSNDMPQPAPNSGIAAAESWDGKSRVTMLLLGLDYNDWRAGETPHSDTMILLSLDPITNTASILSIPRDLWVNIPGFDYGRINEAYFNGAAYN
ncbi:MAG: LCP family protein, partial [Anaerolineaceae bacterium]|nr:LCP family protein [Anaerolineaceae bacterium]